MNAMVQALQAAGVKTPTQMQRIWSHLNSVNRPMTSEDLSKALNLPVASTSSVLSDMALRGMVDVSKQKNNNGRLVAYYRNTSQHYSLLPRPAKHDTRIQTLTERQIAAQRALSQIVREQMALAPVAQVKVEHKEAAPREVITLRRPIRIEDWTIAEAREVYNKLKGMFA